MNTAARLRDLRLAAGQSLKDVERGTRLHVALLRTLEAGRPMTAAQASLLERHFGEALVCETLQDTIHSVS